MRGGSQTELCSPLRKLLLRLLNLLIQFRDFSRIVALLVGIGPYFLQLLETLTEYGNAFLRFFVHAFPFRDEVRRTDTSN